MINLEDPIQFSLVKKSQDITVTYSKVMEICQGGPEIGFITINGRNIKGQRFGGPCLIEGEFIYAPIYIKKIFGRGFKISKIHSGTLKIDILGSFRELIYLDRIEEGLIHFFLDLNKTIPAKCNS